MVGFLLFVSLVGCTKLNQDNYNKIKVGMDYPQVIQIIGKPDKCDAALGTKGCIWGNDQKNITIQFIADKVVFSSMKGL
ncbi:MAG: outer membrane protein assembly factor BamE [Desulfobacteraceae bacterium]|nr:outer membrane protein assembly factor BamE [Desulfobacteraceae bacterium]